MITTKDLNNNETLAFNNEHEPWSDSQMLEISTEQISSWDNPYKIVFNGSLIASYKTATIAVKKINMLIDKYNLNRSIE